MSIRDLGVIELTVFAALLALFVMFFGLFVMLRHRKRTANSRKLLKKRALMEEAVREKVRPARGKVRQEMAVEDRVYRPGREGIGQEADHGFEGRTAGQKVAEESERYDGGRRIAGQETAIKIEAGAKEVGKYDLERPDAGQAKAMEPETEKSGTYHPEKRTTVRGTTTKPEEFEVPAPSKQKGAARKIIVKKREEMRDATRKHAYTGFSGNRAVLSEEYGEEIAGNMGDGQQDTQKRENARVLQDGSVFVEHRRISHRRDQLKRLEEAK